jgi:hypothetical protein
MWQSVAAHHGLDPQPSLAHEQQLAELTRGPVRSVFCQWDAVQSLSVQSIRRVL